jgi:DNA-binding beta-propeller fold protein YncE
VGAVDPVKNLLFAVPAQDATQLQIVSGGPGPETVVRTATLPFTASFGSLAVNPVLSHLYVGDSADNSIAVLDETSGITLATIALGSGNTPGPLAVDPVRNLLYALVSSANGTQLYVLQDGGN